VIIEAEMEYIWSMITYGEAELRNWPLILCGNKAREILF